MNLTVERLKELFVKLGGAGSVVAGFSTIVEVLNAIAAKYDGKDDAILNPDAISNITAVADKIGGGIPANALVVEGVTAMADRAFNVYESTDSITRVIIPASLRKVSNGAFWDCTNLTDLTISEGVQEIGESAFYNSNIAEIILPDGVVEIGDEAFGFASGCRKISTDAQTIGSLAFAQHDGPGDDPSIPPEQRTVLDLFELREGVKSIGEKAFRGIQYNSPLILPSTIEALDSRAFEDMYVDTICVPFSEDSSLAQDAPWGAFTTDTTGHERPQIVYNYTGD